MRIGFDISQTGKAKAGCGYFAEGLIRHLAATDSDNDYILYPAFGDYFWDSGYGATGFKTNKRNFRQLTPPRDRETFRRFWRNPGADFEAKLGKPDIVQSNNFYCPDGLIRARLVYTLYDLNFLEHSSWGTEENRLACFEGVFKASLFANHIVAISEYTKRHFLSTFPHFPEQRISVIYPASRFDSTETAAAKPSPGVEAGQFWLAVGTVEPRKNYHRLLEAYCIVQQNAKSAYPLVIAGGSGWLMEDFDAAKPGVIMAGYLSDSELRWLFRNCFAFVYPSLFEGFGMPVLEALSLGAPVLCSNTTSLPEAAGNAALYFDPTDAANIANAMLQVLRKEVDRTVLKSAAYEQAKRFSWKSSAARLLELYAGIKPAATSATALL